MTTFLEESEAQKAVREYQERLVAKIKMKFRDVPELEQLLLRIIYS